MPGPGVPGAGPDPAPAAGGMGMGGGMGPLLYNPQTVTTVTGQVEKLEELPSMGRGGGVGMQYRGVLLKTDQGSLLVHLGPGWYLDEKKFAVKVGDTVEVTGSKVTLNNQPALIAREVKVNGTTLKLRDDQGLPVWRGMGQGPGRWLGPVSGWQLGRSSSGTIQPRGTDPGPVFFDIGPQRGCIFSPLPIGGEARVRLGTKIAAIRPSASGYVSHPALAPVAREVEATYEPDQAGSGLTSEGVRHDDAKLGSMGTVAVGGGRRC